MLKSITVSVVKLVVCFVVCWFAAICGNSTYDLLTSASWEQYQNDSRIIERNKEVTQSEAFATRECVAAEIRAVQNELGALREALRILEDSRTAASWTVTVTPNPAMSSPSVTSLSE